MKIEAVLATTYAEVVTVRPDQSLRDAAELLARYDIGVLIVVDERGKLLGIISERDIVREAARTETVLAQPVRRVMTEKLITASPQDDVEPCLRTMIGMHFRHVPIVDQQELVGVISIGDVLKAQLNMSRGEVDTLQTQIIEGQD